MFIYLKSVYVSELFKCAGKTQKRESLVTKIHTWALACIFASKGGNSLDLRWLICDTSLSAWALEFSKADWTASAETPAWTGAAATGSGAGATLVVVPDEF